MLKYLTKNKGELALTLTVSVMAVCGYVGWSFLLQLVVDIATGKRAGDLVTLGGFFVLYMIVMDSIGGLDQFLRPRLKWRAAKRARTALMAHAFAESPADFAQVGVGTMIGKLTKQLDNVTQSFFGEALWLFYISVQMLIATASTLAISPLVTGLIFLLSIPALVFPFLLKKVLSRASDEQVAAIDAYAAKATDLLSGFATLKYALAGPAAKHQHEQLNAALFNAQTRNTRLAATSFAISAMLNDITYMAAWFLGAVMVQRGQMDMGQMVVFSTLTGYLTFPMMSLTQDIPTLIGGARAAQKLAAFIDAPVAAAAGTAQPQVTTPIAALRQAGFTAAGRDVLAALDLTLTPGQKVLLVGASGSGKTTLVRLLLGELAPTEGTATLFGVPATALARAAAYARIGFMTQAGHVFTGTVRENLGLFSDTYSDAAMSAAMQRAGLGPWLAAHSLDTTVGAADPTLSGGEQQRLALARLFLRGADYYVFDELTTVLDPHIAAGLLRDLFAMPQGFLMITHTYNEAAFAQADTILVLDAGRIVARGPVTTPAVRTALQGLELVAAD
ncbi:ATP-binding cassette domain-containing protein [Lacticaseibacillus daqingensis]|uniref:ATP-binding cassette domain-containing protein n=1 Tax=Lacticaseibacillus daqingensis TaxID=2486014 RepID=UPI000F776ACF|nr:ABC transporter ATP-binding protein [Lacticaseibacillus daqingensis]